MAKIKPQKILEIGTWRGGSAEVWIRAFDPDLFFTYEKDEESSFEELVKLPLEMTYYRKWMYFYGFDSHDPERIKYLTDPINNIGLFDFMFIDGDHSLEGVTKDWEMYSPLIKKGGIIAFHDVLHYNKEPEVNIKPLWDELKTKYPYVEIKVGKSSTGIGVLYV